MRRRDLLLGAAGAAGLAAGAPPAHAAAPPPDNGIVLRDQSGAGARQYPLRLGRPFAQGEIRNAPQAVLGGQALPTQAEVKTRWPDGSVQHAVLSCIVPHIPADGRVAVRFADQPATAGAALGAAAMLDSRFDFDIAIRLTAAGQQRVVRARQMLEAGHYTVFAAGPIASTIVLADHSVERRYDLGFDAMRSFRPIFHATFWPGLDAVEVRVIGENANTETLQDIAYDVEVFAGAAVPRPIFAQSGVRHYLATRWSRSFWLKGAPQAKIGIHHNLAYLAHSRAIPNFDPTLQLPEAVIARDYAHWEAAPKDLYDAGLWNKVMPAAGGRDDLGHFPGHVIRWLYSGDWRHMLVARGMADLAAAWPVHVREGDPAKRFDAQGRIPALGRVPTIYARPTEWLLDDRDRATPADKVTLHGERLLQAKWPRGSGGWVNDGNHQPDPYSALYLLTGDPFMLEQLQLWAAVQAMSYNPGYRGPSPRPGAGIRDQVRGCAWAFRNRVNAAFLSPDGTPEKAYLQDIVGQAIAYWEGAHGVPGARYAGTELWRFGDKQPYRSPLRMFGDLPASPGAGVDPHKASKATALWEHYMLLFEVAHATERGFDSGPLLAWLAPVLTRQFQEQPSYSPFNVARYYTAARDMEGAFFPTWTATLAAYEKPDQPTKFTPNVGDGYAAYACGAAAIVADQPGGAAAYAWMREHFYLPNRRLYAANPKWAVLPRA